MRAGSGGLRPERDFAFPKMQTTSIRGSVLPVNLEVERTVSANHPCLPGHFPGGPIVPAVVIADEINAALSEWRRDYETVGINALKFLAPLKPDQPFVISFAGENRRPEEIDVVCRVDDRIIVRGRLLMRRRPI